MLRSHTCGELRKGHPGKSVQLCGWVDTIRNHGRLWFLDLRDRYGKTQAVFHEKKGDFSALKNLALESCISVSGKVVERKKGTENKELETGEIEISGEKIEVFSKAEGLPFEIGDENVGEDVRLKHRYLDMRGHKLQANLVFRHKAVQFIRDFLDREGFIEVTTPILTKSTPEGARDFIVPSRLHPGKFYALPQSPQQYKQLIMVGGIDKYFQIAPCFRDEDARADRSPGEFYQLDLEMSFVEQDDILDVIERMYIGLVRNVFPSKKISKIPFPKLKYKDVMKKYGTDKPDIRKDKKDSNELAFCWIVDFPLFEPEMEGSHYAPMHHMFTMPKEEDWDKLTKAKAKDALSYQHDLVLNGFEVGGGSMRIHRPDIQQKVFDLIGFDMRDNIYFSHMLEAFKFGPPPHGGIAPGIDRSLMVVMGEPNIRELIAFPKNKAAQEPVMDAPSEIKPQQLKEVHIKLDVSKKGKKQR